MPLLVPSVTDNRWLESADCAEMRVIDNVATRSADHLEVTVNMGSAQRYCFVNVRELEKAGLEIGALHIGAFIVTSFFRPLGLLVETDDEVDNLKLIPFYYPREDNF